VVLQVNAAQSRHLHIAYDARCAADLPGFEKFVGRGKRGSVVAERLHERFRRIAHGFIVIDNRNQYLSHSALRGLPAGWRERGRVSQPLTPFRVSEKEQYTILRGMGSIRAFSLSVQVDNSCRPVQIGLPPNGLF
jgi:hypothetical protein